MRLSIFLCVVCAAFGQATDNARRPAPAHPQTDFAAAAAVLQNTPAPAAPTPGSSTKVPPDYHPNGDAPLTPTALEAVRVSANLRAEANAPSPGPDGRVVYSFGTGLPTVVCAPLRVCIIELQAGEKITGEPQIGDSVRWSIAPAMYGAAEEATPVIVLKPHMPGLDTNLLITTDRRAYYFRLISRAEDYVSRIAFAYPDDDSARQWQQQMAGQRAQAKQGDRPAELTPAMIAVENLNFDYTVTGSDEHLRPLRVYDDGSKTYIQMQPEMQHREAPVLLVVGADGKGEITNYRVKNQTYIVDRLFDHAELVLGAGKKAKGQKVEIVRERKG
jgi:type IV secretion system protein VirB9